MKWNINLQVYSCAGAEFNSAPSFAPLLMLDVIIQQRNMRMITSAWDEQNRDAGDASLCDIVRNDATPYCNAKSLPYDFTYNLSPIRAGQHLAPTFEKPKRNVPSGDGTLQC